MKAVICISICNAYYLSFKYEHKFSNPGFSVVTSWIRVHFSVIPTKRHWSMTKWPFQTCDAVSTIIIWKTMFAYE